MGKMLFIGVTCVDVVINVDKLPCTAEDVVVYGQKMALGGCAFNAFSIAHALGEPSVLFSPVGTGAFGDFVRKGLASEGVEVLVENDVMENGCCYCYVEPDGERTFVSYHGADYHYEPEWFDALDMDAIDAVYVCGLEIEDPTGPVIVEFLERACAGKEIFFTPGPRPDAIPRDLLERVCALGPMLHMNGDEAMALAARLCDGEEACADVPSAVRALARRVGNTVFATLGADGCRYDDGCRCGMVPGVAALVVDTIGAGDSHIGALMVGLHRGEAPEGAIARANRVAAAIVGISGAHADPKVIRAAAR